MQDLDSLDILFELVRLLLQCLLVPLRIVQGNHIAVRRESLINIGCLLGDILQTVLGLRLILLQQSILGSDLGASLVVALDLIFLLDGDIGDRSLAMVQRYLVFELQWMERAHAYFI